VARDKKMKYRLVTRKDFDGLVCGVLLKERGLVGEVKFAHPKDMQDGKVPIRDSDIIANLPYVSGCHLAFDHHASEELRVDERYEANHIFDPVAPSAARVIYDHFGGQQAFRPAIADIVAAADRADSAQFTLEEVLDARGWTLLHFLLDPRTGLGRFHQFRVSDDELVTALTSFCRDHTIDEVLELTDVAERAALYREHQPLAVEQIRRCAHAEDSVVVLDLRAEETIFVANRFLVYALFPQGKVAIHVLWGKDKRNTVVAAGKSILDRSATCHLGNLLLQYGGGGHAAAATCQVENADADRILREIVEAIKVDEVG
jgi:nanoRNase/pAp phosphatase (c-di-AMP/oligoRNAs hydrolase)